MKTCGMPSGANLQPWHFVVVSDPAIKRRIRDAAAIRVAGLVSLTHTPSPMKFLNEILGRPKDIERPFLLLVVGYPAVDAKVPDISRKPLAEIATFV